MNLSEYAFWWVVSFFSGLTAITARLMYTLFGISAEPPEDPVQLKHWHRKRRWLIISDYSALPFFATAALFLQIHFHLNPITNVGITMVFGALGFGALLHGIELTWKRKLKAWGERV